MALCSLDHHGLVAVVVGAAADLQWKEGYT